MILTLILFALQCQTFIARERRGYYASRKMLGQALNINVQPSAGYSGRQTFSVDLQGDSNVKDLRQIILDNGFSFYSKVFINGQLLPMTIRNFNEQIHIYRLSNGGTINIEPAPSDTESEKLMYYGFDGSNFADVLVSSIEDQDFVFTGNFISDIHDSSDDIFYADFECDAEGRLTSIQVMGWGEYSSRAINGVVNWEIISKFSALKDISLSYQRLSGEINLEAIAQLTNLEILDLSGNSFSGEIKWEAIAGLTHLKTLDLEDNSFSGEIDWAAISTLTNLDSLLLAGNSFSGEIGDLTGCTNLRRLTLGDDFTMNDQRKLYKLPSQLQKLTLSGNKRIAGSIGDLNYLSSLLAVALSLFIIVYKRYSNMTSHC